MSMYNAVLKRVRYEIKYFLLYKICEEKFVRDLSVES